MFPYLFSILYDSCIKIVGAHQPLHNLLSFLYFYYAFAMFCWFILTVIQYLSHYFSLQIVLRQKDGLKGAKESSFSLVFEAQSQSVSHISLVEKIEGQTSCFFLLRLDPLLTLSNGQAAVSMPLVYYFYWEESIDSLSSKLQFSGLRMSPVDPLSDQVPSGVWLDWLCSYLFVQQQTFYPLQWKQLRSQGPQPKE